MARHEPLLHVKAVETGVIDVSCSSFEPVIALRMQVDCENGSGSHLIGKHLMRQMRLMVQECFAKTGIEQLRVQERP